MAVRENVPRPEYAAGQRRCIRRLDGGGGKNHATLLKGWRPQQQATEWRNGLFPMGTKISF